MNSVHGYHFALVADGRLEDGDKIRGWGRGETPPAQEPKTLGFRVAVARPRSTVPAKLC